MCNKIKLLLFALSITCQIGFSQQNSENGYSINPHTQLKILVVWAEATTGGFTSPSLVTNYGKGVLPSDANDFFDLTYTPGVEPTTYLSKYFYQMSFGKHIVLCDHLDHVVQVNINNPNLGTGYRVIYDYLNALYNQNQSQFSANNLVGQSPLSNFDTHNILPNYAGLNKANIANTKFDGIIILWKGHPSYAGGGYAFVPQAGNGNYATLGFTGVENDAAFGGSSGEGTKKFIIQEYFHGLYGGNEYHTGAGAGTHAFMAVTNPWGISAQLAGAGVSQAANGWDRHRLGWYGWKDINQSNPKTNLISAVDQSNNEVNTDFTINSTLGTGLFVLRDHVKYGDAIRIKLPHTLDDPAYNQTKNQYLWVENHQKTTAFDHGQWEDISCKDPTKPGMWAFIQVGKDNKNSGNVYTSFPNSDPNAFASFIFPLPAEGNYDFKYTNPHIAADVACVWANKTVAIDKSDVTTLPNPFIGYNDLYNYYNSNGNNQLSASGGDIYQPGLSEIISGTTVYNAHYHGDGEDAYNFTTGKTKISLSTNPSPTSVYTYATFNFGSPSPPDQHTKPYENRTIWLNGISVEIMQENYQPSTYGAGAILVKVRFDNYEVNQPVRWCGNIKVSPNDFDATPGDFTDNMYAVNVMQGGSILLDRSRSYTRHYAIDQNPITNENRFSEPTEMTILTNAYFHMQQGTNMVIDGESTVRIKNNGRLEVHENGSITVKKGSKLILESGAQLAVWDNAIVKIEAGGQLEYDNSTINLIGNNSIVEFEGNLKIANNADFKFIGLGYVKFSQPGWINPTNNPSNIIAGTGSKITLKGTNKNDKVLEVTQESMYAHMPLSKFTLQNGTAELGSNSRISVDGDLLISNAKITSTAGSFDDHRGLNTYGQSNVVISLSTFEKGKFGIYSTLTYGGAPITINSSVFQNCEVGLTTIDKGATLNNCTFQNNDIGWDANGMIFPCRSNSNTVKLNGIGYNFTAGSTSSLFINKPNITQNYNNGVIFDGSAMVTVACGNITNNGVVGILFKNNSILNNNSIVAPYGGKTNMSGNYNAVEASCANNWYLIGGRNNFTSTNLVASGTFNFGCNGPQINGLNNQWKNPNAGPLYGTDYTIRTCVCSPPRSINLFDNSPMNAIGCGIIWNPNPTETNALNRASPIEHCPGCEKITTADFNQVKLNDAVKLAISYLEIADSTKNDVTAINLLSQILTYQYKQGNKKSNKLTYEELWLLELSYSKIKEALSNGIQHNKIISNYSAIPVQQVLKSADSLAKRIDFAGNDDKQLYFKLDKASIYKLVSEREKSLLEIDAIKNCYVHDSDQVKYINNLRNVIYTEQLLVSGKINKEDFQSVFDKIKNGTISYNLNGISVVSKSDSSELVGVKIVGDTIDFGAVESGITNNWNFGDCTSENSLNAKHIYGKQGNYTITLNQTFKCANQTKTLGLKILPKPSCSITKNLINKTCDLSYYAIQKNINLNDSIAHCYSNGSTKLANMNNLRFKLEWDFNTPGKNDFTEYFTYNQILQNQDSLIHIQILVGDSAKIKLTNSMQINIGGNWFETGYKKIINDLIYDGSAFTANISIDNLFCQMDSMSFKANIIGGTAPYSILWDFGDGVTSTQINPIHLFKTSGEYSISILIKDSLGCKPIINFPQSKGGHADYVGPDKDSTDIHIKKYEIIVPQCKSINGYAVIQSNCGNNPVSGVSFALLDDQGVVANLKTVSDNQGYFEFNPVILSSLDSTKQYSIFAIQPSKYVVLKPYFDMISSLENTSPLTVYLGAAKEDGVIKRTTPETISTSMIAVDKLNNKYIGGTINEVSSNYYLEKQDSIGNIMWIAKYDGYAAGTDSAKAVYVDSTSNVYVTGKSWNGAGYDYATIKYDSTGSTQWIARYGDTTSVNNIATAINQDSLGNIRVSGKNLGQTIVYTTVIYSDCKFATTLTARAKNNNILNDKTNEIQQYYSTALSVFPNPNNGGILNISCTETINEPLRFELYDNTGRNIFTKIFNGKQENIPINNIVATGIYFYYIRGTQSGAAYKKDKLVIIKN